MSLCALFENLVTILIVRNITREINNNCSSQVELHEPDLWTHLVRYEIQPLRLVFRWIMRGFAGHLPPEQLLFLWDLLLAYDTMEVFPLLAATILSFRRDNIMQVHSLAGVEAVLADLSSLPVIPLIQLALEKNRKKGGRTTV